MYKAMVKAKEKDITSNVLIVRIIIISYRYEISRKYMTWRNIYLAKYTGCKLHIAHVSTRESMNI